ncbi:MAG: hypothetical protein J0L92_25890 [Deltaproteobacteria bacterium]|nr:hypothetical protein [Deltaproteobacteria bacterium]
MPRYVRVARALALLSGALTTSSLVGCYQTHERLTDAGPIDAVSLDADVDAGRCPTPLPCTCRTLVAMGTCDDTPYVSCCPIVGPLSPPDLPI